MVSKQFQCFSCLVRIKKCWSMQVRVKHAYIPKLHRYMNTQHTHLHTYIQHTTYQHTHQHTKGIQNWISTYCLLNSEFGCVQFGLILLLRTWEEKSNLPAKSNGSITLDSKWNGNCKKRGHCRLNFHQFCPQMVASYRFLGEALSLYMVWCIFSTQLNPPLLK